MQQLQGDAQRKKDEQDRLLRDIESSQSVNKVARPIAQLIDFLSNANKFQSGTSLAGNFPKDIDEQRINATLAGYVNPSNDEMLSLLKMQTDKEIAGMRAAEDKSLQRKIKFDTEYRKDPLTKTLQEKALAYDTIGDLTGIQLKNNPMAQNMAKRAIVISTGDKRPSDKDIDQFGNSPEMLNLAQALWDKYNSGQYFTDKDKQNIIDIVNITKLSTQKMLNKHNKRWLDKASVTYGINPDEGKDVVDAASMVSFSESEEEINKAESKIKAIPELKKLRIQFDKSKTPQEKDALANTISQVEKEFGIVYGSDY